MTEVKTRILIVEDERIIALDIKRVLEKIGYDVINIVKSGEAAIDLSGELKPDIILMDIMLSCAIIGVGARKGVSAVRWGVTKNIFWAWILTIPISAIISAFFYLIFNSIN